MRHRRRAYTLLLLGTVAVLGVVLFSSVQPSTMFSILAPVAPPAPVNPAATPTLTGPLAQVSGTTLLENPRYTGQDTLGRTWTVEAETALQGGTAASSTYILQHVAAEWADPARPAPFRLTATEGYYTPTSSTLQLTGSVRATGLNFTLSAPVLQADLTTRILTAPQGSQVTGPLGRWQASITAPLLRANPASGTLLFSGGVRAQLTPTR